MTDDLHRAVLRERHVLSPHLLRLRVGGLDRFESTGVGDEWVRLVLPSPADDTAGPVARYYTVRAWHPHRREADIDVVRHRPGAAAAWAESAPAGSTLLLSPPRSAYDPPAETRRVRLLGDVTALPAIGRILAEERRWPVEAVVQVEHEEDRAALPDERVTWLVAPSAQRGLEQRLRAEPPAAGDFVWFSGEAGQVRAVRRLLRHELGLPAACYSTMGYWRRDSERWRRRYDAMPATARRELETIYDSALPAEEKRDLAEALLARWKVEEA